MKIKTVANKINPAGIADFDKTVNKSLDDGWRLVKRETIPGYTLGDNAYFAPSLYAELVQLDEPEEPETPAGPPDPLEALRTVRDFCAARQVTPNGVCKGCRLEPFCGQNEGEKTPDLWEVPEE